MIKLRYEKVSIYPDYQNDYIECKCNYLSLSLIYYREREREERERGERERGERERGQRGRGERDRDLVLLVPLIYQVLLITRYDTFSIDMPLF